MKLPVVRFSANRDDTAGDDGPDVQRFGAPDQTLALGAGIQPDLGDLLLRHVFDHLFADFRRYVEGRHVDRAGNVEHRSIRLQPLHFPFVGIDRHHRVSLLAKRPEGTVAELAAIVAGADDGDGLWHKRRPAEAGRYATSAFAWARANAIRRRLPSCRMSIDVA